MTIGEFLRRRRAECGIGQEELAVRLGVTQQTVSRWENGQGLPRPKRVTQLAELLDVDPALVHRAAGYLPPRDDDAALDAMDFGDLSEEELLDLIERAWRHLRARRSLGSQRRGVQEQTVQERTVQE